MLQELSQDFVKYYRTNVKELALLCSKDFKILIDIENHPEKYNDKSKEVLQFRKLKDVSAVWYIGYMVSDIERCILNGINLNLINSVSTVNNCLNSDTYWLNVWNNEISSEEAKNLKKLSAVVKELIKYL